ncbi:3'-phosphoadenosine 5'-phosphosulfate sulfotransferase (PAPS reductase)/FAD synthetase/predicted RNA-binding protein with PUA domain [Methanococcus voltae]|uniref:phosphoadenosine phosphosulfate reductase domain-containing protein n=1 Tax=Methanococcus voltae TaxID=2188 RepID=UPI0032AFA321|nr:3'-phosphoadenosine 5'-phosphosulfate sulfotransferase (PAPS reductase)/FAD synthetase/predicted RNA-binding protein with PUA domain [Methanococcus voltae]
MNKRFGSVLNISRKVSETRGSSRKWEKEDKKSADEKGEYKKNNKFEKNNKSKPKSNLFDLEDYVDKSKKSDNPKNKGKTSPKFKGKNPNKNGDAKNNKNNKNIKKDGKNKSYIDNSNIEPRESLQKKLNLKTNLESWYPEFYYKQDAKFASPHELNILSKLTNIDFKDNVVILERLSGMDYRKRVIYGKKQLGILEYDLKELIWQFVPNPEYYMYLNKYNIELKPSKMRLKGKWIKEEYLVEEKDNLKAYNTIVNAPENDLDSQVKDVGIKMGNFAGHGVKSGDRIKLKDLSKISDFEEEKLSEYLEKRSKYVEILKNNSLKILKHMIEKYKKKGYVINASFSGGKDSSVSTLLAKEVMPDIEVISIDTGLEYPETIEYIKKFSKKYDLNMDIIDGDNFWEDILRNGVPTKDNRWCNSSCKLNPLRSYLKKKYPGKKILTIDGSRQFESFTRSNLDYERNSSFIDFQTTAFPILDWNALDIWTYIYKNDIPYNPLYDEGFERIGCYLCPSALNSEFNRVKELHPDYYKRWSKYLSKRYSKDEIDRGFWRWDELPPKMKELKKEMDN